MIKNIYKVVFIAKNKSQAALESNWSEMPRGGIDHVSHATFHRNGAWDASISHIQNFLGPSESLICRTHPDPFLRALTLPIHFRCPNLRQAVFCSFVVHSKPFELFPLDLKLLNP